MSRQNYDFGAHWTTQVVPHLDSPAMQRAVRECAESYLAMYPDCAEVYCPNTPLAGYSSTDCYYTLMERKGNLYLAANAANLPPRYLELQQQDRIDENFDEWMELRERILEPLHARDRIKHALESYYLPCACHWYSPTVMLTLARLVEPTEHWAVRTGPEHTTVVNRARTRVFDLIYWGLEGRLENYLFGDTIKSHDASMGGELAFANSRPERRKRRKH